MDHEPKHEIRTSKLPVCGLLHTLDILEDKSNPIPYSQDFFTGIGNSIHETLQTHFPLTKDVKGYVFGDWKCSNLQCKNIIR